MLLFKSFTHCSFALLWSGQTISRLGDSLYRITLAWWVLEKTGSAIVMGTLLTFSFAPMLLFLPIGGVVVDRFPRVRVMLVSELLSGITVSIVALLAFGNLLEIWHVYIASIIFGLLSSFYRPAYAATVPEILPGEALPSANSLTSMSEQIASVLGPAVGAYIVKLSSTSAALALDGVSFFISASSLVILLGSSGQRKNPKATSLLRDLREALSMLFGTPWMWITTAILALINITLGAPVNVTLPFLVKDTLHGDVGTLGLVYMAFSLGAVIGAVWLSLAETIRRRGLKIYGALIVVGLATLTLGMPITLIGVILAILVSGASVTISNLALTNILQERVPPEMLGRISSINSLGSFVLLPVGFALAGWATDKFGAPLVFMIGGALTIGLATLGLSQPLIRHLD